MYLPTRGGGAWYKGESVYVEKFEAEVVKRKVIIQLKKFFLDGSLKEFWSFFHFKRIK